MSNRIVEAATGDSFTEGSSHTAAWLVGVRSAFASVDSDSTDHDLQQQQQIMRLRTPNLAGRGSFASVPHAAGYLCLVHPATGLQVELKQDSNGWFALRGGGGGGVVAAAALPGSAVAAITLPCQTEPEQQQELPPTDALADVQQEAARRKWQFPVDACVWSDGAVQGQPDACLRVPVQHFVRVARRRALACR